MRIHQTQRIGGEWTQPLSANGNGPADLVLVFGGRAQLQDPGLAADLVGSFAGAEVLGCSTAGEIHGTRVLDDSVTVTSVGFEHTTLKSVNACAGDTPDSYAVGRQLVAALPYDGLAHVFVLSNGLEVNGSQLARGMTDALPPGVHVTGGLAGDGDRFEQTLVISGSKKVSSKLVAAIGLYGDRIRIGHGSLGGWDSFGPQRLVTRAEGNVLFSLDGKPALDLYKTYLGEHAKALPSSGLLFPLSVEIEGIEGELVRTILSVDERAGSLTFAGDIPEGSLARLMKANFDRLIDGAAGAAHDTAQSMTNGSAELAILISCVGRKLVLKQRVEEEVEAVQGVLGGGVAMTGFYSYGEISPTSRTASCELHNQTMTITTLAEA